MTVLQGIDYSFARPGGAAIRAANKLFAMRYLPYGGDGGKGLTKQEVVDLHSNDIGIGVFFESTAGRMFDGYPAGVADARTARFGLAELGAPPIPVFFACDVDTTPDQLALVDDYLRGTASVIGLERNGIYGEYDVIDHCQKAGTATFFCQCYAWSYGRKHPYRHVYQYLNGQTINGGAVDYDEAYGDTSWLWRPKGEDLTKDEAREVALQVLNEALRGDVKGVPGVVGADSFLAFLAQAIKAQESSFEDTDTQDKIIAVLRGFGAMSPLADTHSHEVAFNPFRTGPPVYKGDK